MDISTTKQGFFRIKEESKARKLPVYLNSFSENYEQARMLYQTGSEFNHIYYVKKGSGIIERKGKKLAFSEGDFFVFKSGVSILFYPNEKKMTVKYVTVGGNGCESIFEYYKLPEMMVFKNQNLEKSFDKIFTNIYNGMELEKLSAKLYSFIVELGIAYDTGEEKSSFEKVLAYIDNHYYHDISVKDIAAFANISESSLFKQFKKYLNISPVAYLNKLRVNWAKYHLLTDNRISIEEIGNMVGFHSTSYFIESFKNFEGVTPHKFRKEKLNKGE